MEPPQPQPPPQLIFWTHLVADGQVIPYFYPPAAQTLMREGRLCLRCVSFQSVAKNDDGVVWRMMCCVCVREAQRIARCSCGRVRYVDPMGWIAEYCRACWRKKRGA